MASIWTTLIPRAFFANPFAADAAPIVFTGTMDYRPNIEGVEWFAHQVLPLVRHNHPNAEFWIVGSYPSARVTKLAQKSAIRVTGRVADVRPYLAHAHCVVAPLHIARGLQNKVLEAMAMARPVVATPAACEGTLGESGTGFVARRNCRCVRKRRIAGRCRGIAGLRTSSPPLCGGRLQLVTQSEGTRRTVSS